MTRDRHSHLLTPDPIKFDYARAYYLTPHQYDELRTAYYEQDEWHPYWETRDEHQARMENR